MLGKVRRIWGGGRDWGGGGLYERRGTGADEGDRFGWEPSEVVVRMVGEWGKKMIKKREG